MLSTCSEPRSNRYFVTLATSSLSRTPGLSCSESSWYAPSTIAQAMLSRMISSIDLTSRASSMTCWPSRTVTPSSARAASIGGSTMSTPIGMSATPSARRIAAISRAADRNRPASGATAPRRPTMPGVDVLLAQPRAVEPVVLGGRAEVPDVRVAAAGQQRVAGHLVARPLPDVGARDVADVVEVEQQDCAEVRRGERRPGACRAGRCAAGRRSSAPPSRRSSSRARRSGGVTTRTPVRSIADRSEPGAGRRVFIHATQPDRRASPTATVAAGVRWQSGVRSWDVDRNSCNMA